MATGKTIVQQIRLDGGLEIKSQLDQIGEAGSKAFAKLRDAANSSGIIKSVGDAIDSVKVKAVAIGDAFGNVGKNFEKLEKSLKASAKSIAIVGGAVAGAATGFLLLLQNAAESSNAVKDQADALGLTTKQYQGYAFAAAQSGVAGDQFNKMMQKFVGAADAAGNSGRDFQKKQAVLTRELNLGRISFEEYNQKLEDMRFEANQNVTAFSRLGVQLKFNSDGTVNFNESFDRTVDAFTRFPQGATKSAIAMELFGTKNASAVGFVNNGSEAITRLRAESERVAPVLSDLAAGAMDRFTKASSTLGAAAYSTKQALLALFAPAFTSGANALTEFVVRARSGILALGASIADKVTPVIVDMIAILEGRDADVKNLWLLTARDAAVSFGKAIYGAVNDIVIPAFNAFMAVLSVVAEAINGLFGTKFTAGQLAAALVIANMVGVFGVLVSTVRLAASAVALLWTAFGPIGIAVAALGAALVYALAKPAEVAKTSTKDIADLEAAAKAAAAGVSSAATSAATDASNTIGSTLGKLPGQLNDATKEIPKSVGNAAAGANAALGEIQNKTTQVTLGMTQTFRDATTASIGFFSELRNSGIRALEDISAAAAKTGASLQAALSGSSFAAGGPVRAFAGGGHVRGPGTGTSDSILARVSDGEYVLPARAVRHYGVAFLDRLRRLAEPMQNFRLERFNLGGLVGAGSLMPVQRLAQGGLVNPAPASGGGRPVYIQMPGGQTIGPMRGDDEVVRQLERAAGRASLRSTGRQPSWKR